LKFIKSKIARMRDEKRPLTLTLSPGEREQEPGFDAVEGVD
jgi:hypothetical protein